MVINKDYNDKDYRVYKCDSDNKYRVYKCDSEASE